MYIEKQDKELRKRARRTVTHVLPFLFLSLTAACAVAADYMVLPAVLMG